MLHVIRIYVPEMSARKPFHHADTWADAQLPPDGTQAQDRVAFFEAVWGALRRYYGTHHLPDFAAIRAAVFGDDSLYWEWDLSTVEMLHPELLTRLGLLDLRGTYVLYLEVDHDDHTDLMCIWEDSLEVFLRHDSLRDDSDLLDGFFRPLYASCERHSIEISQHSFEVTFVDDLGMHTSPLPVFLEQCGLA